MAHRKPHETLRLAALLAASGLALTACTGGGSPAAKAPGAAPAKARPDLFAYVTLVGTGARAGLGDEVVPLDLTRATSTTGATTRPALTVGTFPAAIALSPDGRTAYVADYASGELTPIELRSGRVGRAIPAGAGPAGVAIGPGGRTAYVADAGSNPLGHTLTPVDLATGKAGRPIPVGPGPEGVAVTPDGRTAYVADAGAVVAGQSGAVGHEVTAVDLSTGRTTTIPVGNAPEAIAVSPSGATVYVGNANSGSVTPIAVATNTPGTPIPVGGAPEGIAFSPGGRTAWVSVASAALATGGALVPIDVATGRAGAPVPVGKDPAGVAVTPNGSTAWVAVSGAGRLVPVSLSSGTVGTPVALPGGPYALVLASLVPVRALGAQHQGAQRARPKR